MSNAPDPRRRPPAVKTLDHTVAAVPLLQGRVLLHEHAQYTPRPRPALDDGLSSMVMTGANADARAFQLRADVGYQGTLLIHSAVYTTYTATAEEPFMAPSRRTVRRRGHLAELPEGSRGNRSTDTHRLHTAGELPCPQSGNAGSQPDQRADTLVSLPIDVTWLSRENIGQLIAVCARIRHPKAVILFRQFDPLGQTKDIPANLRRLFTEVEHMSLLRTDLAALDVMAHGALCAGIGVQSSLRHAIPPDEKAQIGKRGGGPTYPHILMPRLMCFKGAEFLSKVYGNADLATCDCEECDGRSLDSFYLSDGETRREAENHNIHTWGAWVNDVAGYRAGSERKTWWRNKCAAAVDRYALENQRIGVGAVQVRVPSTRAAQSMGDTPRHSVARCTPSGELPVDVFQEFPASNRMALAHEGAGWHNNLDRITLDVEQSDAIEVSAHHRLVLAPQRAIDQYGTSSEWSEPLGPLHRRFPAASGHEHHVDVDRLGCQTGNQSVASDHRPLRQALQRSAFPAVQRSGRDRLAERQRHQEVQRIRSRQGWHTRNRPSLPLSRLYSVGRNDLRPLGFDNRQVRIAGYEIAGSQRSRNHTQGLSCRDCHRPTRSRPAPDALPSRAVRAHPYRLPRATGSSLNNKANGPQPALDTGTRPNERQG